MKKIEVKYFLLIFLGTLLFYMGVFLPGEYKILKIGNLQKEGRKVIDSSRFLLLFFSRSDCGYCKRLEKNVLLPMLVSGDYESNLLLRKIQIDDDEAIISFDGSRTTSALVADKFKVMATPTLVFVNGFGEVLKPALVGYQTPDFYSYYLDKTIVASCEKVSCQKP